MGIKEKTYELIRTSFLLCDSLTENRERLEEVKFFHLYHRIGRPGGIPHSYGVLGARRNRERSEVSYGSRAVKVYCYSLARCIPCRQ